VSARSRLLHNKEMSSDDPQTSVPPEDAAAPAQKTVEQAEMVPAQAPADLLVPVQTTPPSLARPEMLVKGLRYLQERIPEFTHLTLQEKRSHARAANLDPEFIESGLHAASVWRDTAMMVDRTGDELRQEDEEIREWEQVVREMRALTDGIEAANVKRKHRLGIAILQIYRMLGGYMRHDSPRENYMRPYYEDMKRAYLRTQQFRRRKKKEAPPQEPAQEPPAE
jgi:hypothetical protein